MANLFLDANELFELAQGARVFGRSGGNEGIALQSGVTGVQLDANLERIDLANNAAEVTFQVTGAGLTIQRGGTTLATATSLNQDTQVRFSDGNVTVRQTGASQFTIEGDDGSTQTVDTSGNTSIGVPLDNDTSSTGDGDGPDDGGGASGNTISGEVLVDDSPASSIPISASTLTVGNENTGSLTLTDGQSRSFTQTDSENVVIAASSNSDGSLTLRNSGTNIITAGADNAFHVGRKGTGDLTVENGAEISTLLFEIGREGNGSATIRGNDTKITASNDNGLFSGDISFASGAASVGRKPGSMASLDILDGAELEIRPGNDQNSDTSGPGINIGRELTSNGDVTVDGDRSQVDIRQDSSIQNFGPFFNVGSGLGQGDLTVSNGGEVSLRGPTSFLAVSRAQSEGPGGAQETSDTSAVEQSTIRIISGGQLTLSGSQDTTVEFAPREGGDAAVTVSGQGSLLSANASNGTATVEVGQAGTASLTITDGGRVDAGVFLYAGGEFVPRGGSPSDFRTEGTGNITVDGSDSELLLDGMRSEDGDGAFLTIGQSGTGSLDVTNGGTVSISSQQGIFPGLEVGDNALASGSVTVAGSGSLIEISGEQGSQGDGGYAGYIGIGTNGTGTMTVRNGGSVVNDPIGTTLIGGSQQIDASTNDDGTLTLTDNGSTFDAGDQLIIGGGFDLETDERVLDQPGTGSVTVENGASLSAGQAEGDGETDIFVGNNGSLQIASGASLTGDVQTANGGTFSMGTSPGLAIVQGDADIGGATTFELDGSAEDQFDRIDASGEVTLGGDVTFDVGGGFAPDVGEAFTIVEADGGTALADDLSVATEGLPDDRAVDVEANDGTIVATVVDPGSGPDALA